MNNSLVASTMGADQINTKVVLDSVEELEEEEEELAWPPFDEADVMAASAKAFDLSEQVFFRGIEDDHESAERVPGSLGNRNALHIKPKLRHGKGKDMRVLEQVYKHKDNANSCEDTTTETIADQSTVSDKKMLSKPAVVDEVSLEHKINLAKRKLHDSYEQIAREKKRRQVQILSTSELPKVAPQKKCRTEKYGSGFAPKLRSFAACH